MRTTAPEAPGWTDRTTRGGRATARFVLVDRTQAAGPHPMRHRNGEEVEARLRQCSLYDPELDLAVETADGEVAGYALFWFDPVTKVGLVEPMRVEDAYQRRGLARAMLTAGLDRLARRGARRLKVGYVTDAARDLYVGAGFRVTATEHDRYADVIAGVNEQVDPEGLEEHGLVKVEAELLHDAPRLDVRLDADADQARHAEHAEAVLDGPRRPRWRGHGRCGPGRSASPPRGRPATRGGTRARPGRRAHRSRAARRPRCRSRAPPSGAGSVRAPPRTPRGSSADGPCGASRSDRRSTRDRVEILVPPETQPKARRLELCHWVIRSLSHSSTRRNTTQALCPPKPNQFETPTVIALSRASFGM